MRGAQVGLIIKSKKAYDLATELAKITGKSVTTVVVDALQTHMKQLQHQQDRETLLQELMEIGKRCSAHIHRPTTALQHADLLYDEVGMPK
jgi:antitoxin VapB